MVAVIALCTAACGAGSDASTFSLADSAGVSLALNVPTSEPPAWHVTGAPLVVLGDEAAGDTPLFAVAAVRLGTDGRVVLAQRVGGEVRTYAPDGSLLWTAGRSGKGPGEFGLLSEVSLLRGDTVAALDPVLERLTVFDPAGRLVASTPFTYPHIKPSPGMVYLPRLTPLGVTDDHETFALVRSVLFLQGAPGARAMSGVLSVFDAAGQAGDSLASLPIASSWENPGGRPPIESIAFVAVLKPFVGNGRLYSARGEAWNVDVYDPSGRRLRSIREARARVPVTQEMVDALPELPQGMARTEHVPDSLPAIGRIVADRAGRVWAVAYRVDDMQPTSARIYDADGRLVGVLPIPGGFQLMDVRDNRLVGVQKDEMGVETVVVYRYTEEAQ